LCLLLAVGHVYLWGIVAGEGVSEGGGGGEGRRGDDLPLLQLGEQLLAAAVQVVQAGLGAAVRRVLSPHTHTHHTDRLLNGHLITVF